AGILAAAGIYALDHNVERLKDDHRHAQAFAAGIEQIGGINLQHPRIETNLVFFDVTSTGLDAREISRRLLARSVRIGVESKYVMRAVFHLDVDAAGAELALTALLDAVAS